MKYEEPKMEILQINITDIITTLSGQQDPHSFSNNNNEEYTFSE